MAVQNAFEEERKMPSSQDMDRRFSEIAKKYRKLRTNDSEPVSVIVNILKNLDSIEAVDVGCSDSVYDLLLYKKLGDKLNLTSLDANEEMLKHLSACLAKNDITSFSAKCSDSATMPFQNNSLDCVLTFDTIYRLHLPVFVSESARVLKSGGYLFVYTKLCEQDNENETPLFTMDTLKQALDTIGSFAVESVVFFAYNGMAALEQLFFSANANHDHNVSRYSQQELEKALKAFSIKIQDGDQDPQQVQWFDNNVLFIIKKEQKISLEYLKIAASSSFPGIMA